MWCPGKERFKVSVDLMAEPCLWRWEIRDPGTNKVVASSWMLRKVLADKIELESVGSGRRRATSSGAT
jgi:hypothetical protein